MTSFCEDFRSRDKSWDYCRIALGLFSAEKIPFSDMTNANALIGNSTDDNSKFCLAKPGDIYLVYLPDGGGTPIDLAGAPGTFSVKWFNPRDGGWSQSTTTISGGSTAALRAPDGEDWLAVIVSSRRRPSNHLPTMKPRSQTKARPMMNLIRLAMLPVMLLACAATLQAADVTVSAPDSPMLRFALGRLESALQAQGDALTHRAHPAEGPAPGLRSSSTPQR